MALSIERQKGERIIVTHDGEELEIQVVWVRKNRVRLALAGPHTFEIWRDEIPESKEDDDD